MSFKKSLQWWWKLFLKSTEICKYGKCLYVWFRKKKGIKKLYHTYIALYFCTITIIIQLKDQTFFANPNFDIRKKLFHEILGIRGRILTTMPGIRKVTMRKLVQTNQYVTWSLSVQQKEASSKSILLIGAHIKPDSDLKCEYSAIIHLGHIKCVIRRVFAYYTRQKSSEVSLTTKIRVFNASAKSISGLSLNINYIKTLMTKWRTINTNNNVTDHSESICLIWSN